jgi:potassium-transporting ATPase KdpC subunit
VATLQAAGASAIPADAVTASASGLDPHISVAFAGLQVDRVAKARGLPAETLRAILQRHIETPFLGIFGEERVNVLELNLALDAQHNPPVG